jgi:hypothetical protein
MCHGLIAGLVMVSSGAPVIEPYAAVIAGIIGAVVYTFTDRWLLVALRVDDAVAAISTQVGPSAGWLQTNRHQSVAVPLLVWWSAWLSSRRDTRLLIQAAAAARFNHPAPPRPAPRRASTAWCPCCSPACLLPLPACAWCLVRTRPPMPLVPSMAAMASSWPAR